MPRPIFFIAVSVGLLAVGCGPDCQNSCNKLYQESQCGIERPGTTLNERLSYCMEECEGALEVPGDQGAYDPNDQRPRSETPQLENDEQAAAWMDCVDKTACENLEKNYCAPVW